MSADRIVVNLRALWRAETLIVDQKIKNLILRSGITAFAALVSTFGLLMAELAAYFALLQIWSAISAAATLSIVNFLIAGLLAFLASKIRPGHELSLANEIQQTAFEALQSDAKSLHDQLIKPLKNPLDVLVPALIVPLSTILLRAINRRKSSAG